MILVTGGAGFIGSNLIKNLNEDGIDDIIVSDYLNERNHKNILDLKFRNFIKPNELFYSQDDISLIVHLGANTVTNDYDAARMVNDNFEYSKELMRQFQDTRIIYASSAAVYGSSTETEEHNDYVPLNIYGYSKLLLDRFVESEYSINVKTGLRFFNVYGPGEQHKGKMSSVIHQLKCGKLTYLFTDGTQKRDFIHVNDVVSIIRHFMRNEVGGTFNVGTGNAISFNEIKETLKLDIPYVDMSETLKSCYQNFTQANVSKLRNIGGYDKNFISIKEGVEMM